MNKINKYLPWTFRIIISVLFLLSAVAKSYPIWAFEKQLVDLGIADWCFAPHLARLIIALELSVAVAILQKHFVKRFVIPGTILLLAVFCVHLGIQMVQSGAMNGNCGCFGQLIPMTPLEALIKNLLSIAILVYLYKHVEQHEKGKNSWSIMALIYSASAWLMFMVFPFAPCKQNEAEPKIPIVFDSLTTSIDSSVLAENIEKMDTAVSKLTTKKDSTIKSPTATDSLAVAKKKGPAPVISKFSEFTQFGNQKVNLDQGEKIVCLFVPGCDHCRDAAKEIAAIGPKNKWPAGYILFMDEELFKIPEFYKETGINYPYHVIENIPTFFKLLGNGATTPGVYYLWNGNIIKSYEGIGDNQFKVKELNAIIANQHK